MTEIIKQTDDRRLRQFAILWVLFFFCLAVRYFWPTHAVYPAALGSGIAFFFGVAGWRWPPVIRPVYVSWMVAATPVGWIISRLVLAILFFGLFTPLAFLFRILGRDALNLRAQPETKSYWIAKTISNDPCQYLRQY
jgi:hypothetical protein